MGTWNFSFTANGWNVLANSRWRQRRAGWNGRGWLAIVLLLAISVPAAADPPAPGKPSSAKGKPALSPAQRKLDSHIVLALKKLRGEPPFDKPTQLDPDLAIEADGRVLIDLDARVSKELLERIQAVGGKVINSFESAHAIRALVPLKQMEALAARPDVTFITPAVQALADPRQDSTRRVPGG